MPDYTYRGNLANATFPMLAESMGRTVIVPQYDNTYTPQIASQNDPDKDRGIPQAYYMQNVVPTAQGYQSIGYSAKTVALAAASFFRNIYILPDVFSGAGNNNYIAYDEATGNVYLWDAGIIGPTLNVWSVLATLTPGPRLVTVATVTGVTYICFGQGEVFKFSRDSGILSAVTLTGLFPTAAEGICAASGYLIVWDNFNTVYHSSVLDPTDFVPSLATGAGSEIPQQLRGVITFIAAVERGFIIYTDRNIVAASYSGNPRYPFAFSEIYSAGGVTDIDLIGIGANDDSHYVYTTHGLQRISLRRAESIFSDVTDFISSGRYEDFNNITNVLTTQALNTAFEIKLNVISSRYLVLSYGPTTTYQYALIYDLALGRWGKLKISHTGTVEWTYDVAINNRARDCIGFIKPDGTVLNVDFNLNTAGNNAALILGKFQFTRNRLMQLQQVELENVEASPVFSCTDLYAVDGKNWQQAPGFEFLSSGQLRVFNFRRTAINHSILLKGGFSLNTIVLKVTQNGNR